MKRGRQWTDTMIKTTITNANNIFVHDPLSASIQTLKQTIHNEWATLLFSLFMLSQNNFQVELVEEKTKPVTFKNTFELGNKIKWLQSTGRSKIHFQLDSHAYFLSALDGNYTNFFGQIMQFNVGAIFIRHRRCCCCHYDRKYLCTKFFKPFPNKCK